MILMNTFCGITYLIVGNTCKDSFCQRAFSNYFSYSTCVQFMIIITHIFFCLCLIVTFNEIFKNSNALKGYRGLLVLVEKYLAHEKIQCRVVLL